MTNRLTAAALASALILGTAPSWAQSELKIAYSNFGGELVDPVHGGLASQIYQMPIFDYLVTFDQHMAFVPGLAERWTVSDGGKTYTFALRKGVKWHTGEEFTGEDVKFHFKRLEKGTAPYIGPLLKAIDAIETPDPYTVIFKLKAPFPDFLGHLSPGNTTIGAITPKAYIERVGEAEFQNNLVGTGPWKLIGRQKGSYFLFEQTGTHTFRPKSGYQRIRLLQVPEESTRLAMLQRGEADLIDIGPDSVEKVKSTGNQVLEIPTSLMTFVSFVGTWSDRAKELNAPTRLEKVRHALSMAIDRKELVDYMMLGRGMPAVTFPTFPGGFGWDEAWNKANDVPFDPEGAKKLLAEAGYPNGFKLRFYTVPLAGAPWNPKMAEVIVDYWKRIGVEVELIVSDAGAVLPVLYSRPDEAIGAAYTYRTTKSVFPVGTVENYLAAKGSSQLAVMNWDDAQAAVASETDPAKREAMFKDLVHRLKESYAMVPVFYASALFAAGKTVANWVPVEGWPSIGISYDYLKPAQ